jgi:hypothetical protein
VQQRTKVATEQLRELIDANNAKLLTAALTEAAAAEAVRNTAFRAAVRRIYEDLSRLPSSPTRTQRTSEQSSVKLIPLPGNEGARFDPFAPLDPYALLRLYGPQQLEAALSGYSISALREAVVLVRQKHPSTKPKDARKIDSLIDYIVQQLTKPQ